MTPEAERRAAELERRIASTQEEPLVLRLTRDNKGNDKGNHKGNHKEDEEDFNTHDIYVDTSCLLYIYH